MKEVKFEWYVLNEIRFSSKFDNDIHFSGGKVKPLNIFDNISVYEATVKLCKDYKTKKMTFEDFTEELRRIICWQEWGRCEYEIMVGTLFEEDINKYQKIDCYSQVLPNISILAEYVLRTYYPRIKL